MFLCAFWSLRVELPQSKRGVGHPENRVRSVVSTVPSGARQPGKAAKLNDQDLLSLKPKRERIEVWLSFFRFLNTGGSISRSSGSFFYSSHSISASSIA